MNKTITINEGSPYEHLPLALGLFILGGILIPFCWYLTPPIWIAGIGVIGINTGIEIDPNNLQIRKYRQFFGMKSGAFQSLKSIVLVKLVMNKNDSKTIIPLRSMAWREAPPKLTTYDMLLIDDTESELVFNQFTKFSLANKTMKAMTYFKQLEIINEVALIMEKQRKNRRR